MAGSDPRGASGFERLVAEAIDGLPDWVHRRLDNVDVVIEERSPSDSPPLLGLYEGVPLTERGVDYTWALPDRIILYRDTIELEAGGDPKRIRRVVADTVVHEVAHFFGISDERLHELGRD
jgi:predicted Zn-dependent protease with MMP-like domain